jgi:hypothetical protein
MSSATDVAADGKTDEDRETADPFAGARIELSEGELRSVSPSAWLGGAKRRIDAVATRLTYGE